MIAVVLILLVLLFVLDAAQRKAFEHAAEHDSTDQIEHGIGALAAGPAPPAAVSGATPPARANGVAVTPGKPPLSETADPGSPGADAIAGLQR